MEEPLTYRRIFDRLAVFFRTVLLVREKPPDIAPLAHQLAYFVVLFPLVPCDEVATIWRLLCGKIDRGIHGDMLGQLMKRFYHMVTTTHWLSECGRIVLPLLLLPSLESALDSHPHLLAVASKSLHADLLILFASMNPGSLLVTAQPVSNFLPLFHFLPLIDASADALMLAVLEKLVAIVLRPLWKHNPSSPLLSLTSDSTSPVEQAEKKKNVEIPDYERQRLLLLDELQTPPKKRPRLEQQRQEAIEAATTGTETKSLLPISAKTANKNGEPVCELKYSASHTSNYQIMATTETSHRRIDTFEALQQLWTTEREAGHLPRLDITRNKIFWCAMLVSLDATTRSVTYINMMNGAKDTHGFLDIRCQTCAHTACRVVAQYSRDATRYSRHAPVDSASK